MGEKVETKERGIRIGVTSGDPNGIGPELILKCFQDPRILKSCDPVVYGTPEVLEHYRGAVGGSKLPIEEVGEPDQASKESLALIRIQEEAFEVNPGKLEEKAGAYAFRSLTRATSDLASGKLDVLLTAPLNKHLVQKVEEGFRGHTEYLTEYANMDESLMLMVDEGLRVGVVTGHVPLEEVPERIDEGSILRKLTLLEQSLKQDFLIEKPRIAVLGLNPHAGESGDLGSQEGAVITPAIERAKKEKGMHCFGPFAADGLFGSHDLGKFHAVLAMYHDQGLAPFKALSFEHGVNFTAGLPIIRTSPDHGTAYGIAGKGEASPNSFRHALYLATDLFRNREQYKEMTSDPLQPQKGSPYMKRGKG